MVAARPSTRVQTIASCWPNERAAQRTICVQNWLKAGHLIHSLPHLGHMPLVKDVVTRLREATNVDIPVVVGGIIPPEDAEQLEQAGVAAVYTPKDFELNRIMTDIVRIVENRAEGG